MERGSHYIPMDWRRAIAKNESLIEHQIGAVLFADVSGFTALTETFSRELGPKRGAEEFTLRLNQVFYGIVADLHRFGGSVVSFSGDAMTCWFNNDIDGRKAVTCALAMQQTLKPQSEITTFSLQKVQLGIKLAVSTGPVRRFLVGSPKYSSHDAMAGRTLERVTAAEGMANRGDVVLDAQTADRLNGQVVIDEWRTNEETNHRFAVISAIADPAKENQWPSIEGELDQNTIQEWTLPSVYERIAASDGAFLSQLRPTFSLFIRFSGIDYDLDAEAPGKLDRFICHLQEVLVNLGGSLLQLTIGDKGSYVYAAFGAPNAYEDDAERVASAALTIMETSDQFNFDQRLQMGIAHGNNWAGAYGGAERRTYGVMGNSVNLAARLMMKAEPGQILINQEAKQKFDLEFNSMPLGKVRFKGKTYETEVFELIGPKLKSGFHLFDAAYRFPMVGREAELAQIEEKLKLVKTGRGQVIGITAEAGMGKSRLAAEVSKVAAQMGIKGFGSEGESFGTNRRYLIWETIWRDIFGLKVGNPIEEQISYLSHQLEEVGEDLVARLPLLSPLVKLTIPDNDLTASLDPKARKTALEALLIDYLRHISQSSSILILLEDVHWIDDLSKDLLALMAAAIENLPVMLLVVYRPPSHVENRVPDLNHLTYFTQITLDQFSPDEVAILIRHKLMQFFSAFNIPSKLLDMVIAKSGGNPFYIEEILNYLKDLEVDVQSGHALSALDLPDTITSLILSRLDRLTQSQQIVVRVASVIGRLFRSSMVHGVYPGNPVQEQVRTDLRVLFDLNLTALEKNEPEETYLFKHIVTQEVTYESLPYKTRSLLHERAGEFIEIQHGHEIDQFADLLAFHFSRSSNRAKKKKYLLRAGEIAQETFANGAAIDYFRQVIPLLEQKERIEVEFKMGEVFELIGDMDEANELYERLISEITASAELESFLHQAQIAMGELRRKQGDFAQAEPYLNQARETATRLNDEAAVAKSLLCIGTLNAQQGELNKALDLYQESLELHKRVNDAPNIANILNNMGVVAEYLGNFPQAKAWFEESLLVRQENGLRSRESISLSNVANMMVELGDSEEAIEYYERALAIQRQVGNRWAMGNTLNNLGNAARELSQIKRASDVYEESLDIYKEIKDKWALAFLLEDVAVLFSMQSLAKKAMFLTGVADKLREEINSPLSEVLKEKLETKLQKARHKLGEEVARQAWMAGRKLDLDNAIGIALDQLSKSGSGKLPDIKGAIDFALDILRNQLDPAYVYHNIIHTELDVTPAAMRLAKLSGLSPEETILLKVAASYHDVGYLNGPAEHEAGSCAVVRKHLPRFDFTEEQIEAICTMIMATRIPQTPANLAGQILADADLDLLGRTDFATVSHRLRVELENTGNKLTDVQWFTQQIGFLGSHTYFTKAAIELRQAQKEKNVDWLREVIEEKSEE